MRRRRSNANPLGSAFNPLTLPLRAWYDSSFGVYQDSAGTVPVVSNGDPVGRWTDRSGNGRNVVQAVAAQRPTYLTGANGQNGLPVIGGDGIDDHLFDAAFDFAPEDWVTFVLAGKAATLPAGSPIVHNITCAAQFVDFTYNNVPRAGQNTFAADFIYATIDVSSAFRCYRMEHRDNNAAAYTLAIDGVAQTLATTGAPVNRVFGAGLRLFAGGGGVNFSDFRLGEVLIVSGQLDAGQKIQVDSYLRRKWGTA